MCVFVHINDLEVQQVLKHLRVKAPDFLIKPVGHVDLLDKINRHQKKIKESKRPRKIIRTSVFHHILRKAKKKNKKRHKKISHETEKSF